jgi:hypothetical protein
MMIEAAKTTATAGEVWVICIVAVLCLAFWLSMVAWADRNPLGRGRQLPEMTGPVLGGMHIGSGGRSVAPNRDAPAMLGDEDEAEAEREEEYETVAAGGAPATAAAPQAGRPWVPGQRGAEHLVPAAGPQEQPVQPGTGQPQTAAAAAGPQGLAEQPEQTQAAQARVPGQGRRAAGQGAGGGRGAVPSMPAQRGGEADKPEHSVAGPGAGDQPGDER